MSSLASPWLGLGVPTVNTCSMTIIVWRSRQVIARLRAATVLMANGSVQRFDVPITYTRTRAADHSDDRALAGQCFILVLKGLKPGGLGN